MNAPVKLTTVEEALVSAFAENVHTLPGSAETTDTRDAAIQAIKANGLPTRKVEAWHYTDLRRLLANLPAGDVETAEVLPTILEGSHLLPIENGVAELTGQLDGLNVELIADALGADVGGYVPEFFGVDDAIGQLNAAFVTGGYRLTVSDSAELAVPVEIQTQTSGAPVHTGNVVAIGAQASATFIDRSSSATDAMSTSVTTVAVKDGATVDWIVVQEEGEAASRLCKLVFDIGEGATVNLFIANFGGKLSRQEVHARCAGENSHLNFRAINMVGDDTHCDITLVLDHKVPNTTSEETVRSVVTGNGQAVFQGQIRVAQIAQKTDAQMAANTLLLSDEAGVSVKPELEIFADDVICAHGATVAEIDEKHLFYLMARGISEKTARGLLVEAFVDELVEELENEQLVEALEDRISNWLEAHG
ncbi:MAG: Fe-S cluster assembly protein SufD [Pseudomonadota bacterium]